MVSTYVTHQVFDGANLLGEYSGSDIPGTVQRSDNGQLRVVFTSDDSLTFRGWGASFSIGKNMKREKVIQ
jgi:hypothetical protein